MTDVSQDPRGSLGRKDLGRTTRKRVKVTRACDACKARKKACTGDIPCSFCVRSALSCTYDVPYHRGAVTSPRPSALQVETAGGIQLAKPCTEHLAASPVNSLTQQSIHASSDTATNKSTPRANDSFRVGGQYRGPASAHSFLDRAVRNFHAAQPHLTSTSEDAYASIFSHGDRHAPRPPASHMCWPDRSTTEHLVQRYFDFASPTYRILHQGTVGRWVAELFGQNETRLTLHTSSEVSSAAQAIILMLCATSSLFSTLYDGSPAPGATQDWQQSETYYQMAEQLLTRETGSPSLESVQARFLTVLYLLSTSRMNQSWFNFGTTIQLLMALGLHRRQTGTRALSYMTSEQVTLECSRRVMWCSFTLDQYLSLILGRPRLLREEDIDQEYPSLVNDEKLDLLNSRPGPARNCLMDAPVCHAKISRILAKASRDLYSIEPLERNTEIRTIGRLMDEISKWQSELPPLLGDWVCPSSLISIFQRQLTVIRLARFHAVMFITRPLLLRDFSQQTSAVESRQKEYLRVCLTTIGDTLRLVLELAKDNLLFPAFWYTQYIAFNAISIAYIYIIHSKRGRIPHNWLFPRDQEYDSDAVDPTVLYQLAEATQYHLGHATEMNALAWRYTVVLEALRIETIGQNDSNGTRDHSPESRDLPNGGEVRQELSTGVERSGDPPFETVLGPGNQQTSVDLTAIPIPLLEPLDASVQSLDQFDPGIGSLLAFNDATDELCLDFWPQLDRLPTSILNPRFL